MTPKFITVNKADGSSEQMEIVSTFRLEETNKDCIIYKGADNKLYAASYTGELENAVLDTNFTDMEKEQLNNIVRELTNGGEANA